MIVHEFGTGLPRFLREVADAWRGFDDTKLIREPGGRVVDLTPGTTVGGRSTARSAYNSLGRRSGKRRRSSTSVLEHIWPPSPTRLSSS